MKFSKNCWSIEPFCQRRSHDIRLTWRTPLGGWLSRNRHYIRWYSFVSVSVPLVGRIQQDEMDFGSLSIDLVLCPSLLLPYSRVANRWRALRGAWICEPTYLVFGSDHQNCSRSQEISRWSRFFTKRGLGCDGCNSVEEHML